MVGKHDSKLQTWQSEQKLRVYTFKHKHKVKRDLTVMYFL